MNLNLQSLNEVLPRLKIQLEGDFVNQNNQNFQNPRELIADQGLSYSITANCSKVSTGQSTSLNLDQEGNVPISQRLQDPFSLSVTQNESSQTLFFRKFQSNQKACFYDDNIQTSLNTDGNIRHDSGFNQDSKMVQETQKMSRSALEMNSTEHKDNSTITFEQILKIQQSSRVSFPLKEKQIQVPEVTAYQSQNFEESCSIDSKRSKLRRLEVCTIIKSVFSQSPINYILGSTEVPYGIPTYTLNGCGTVETYQISCTNIKKPFSLKQTIASTGNVFFFSDSSYLGEYTCVIKVLASDGITSDESFSFSLNILPNVPDPPTNIILLSSTSTSANFAWSPPLNDGGSAIIRYEIWFTEGMGDWQFLGETSDNYFSATILKADTLYNCKIAARNIVGQSIFSQIATYNTSWKVPDPPTNLKVLSTTSTSVNFSWSPPVNNYGLDITGYLIWWQPETNWEQLVASQTDTSFTSTGLIPGKFYLFSVVAINHWGTGNLSSLIGTHTTGGVNFDVSEAPLQLMASSTDSQSVDLSWIPPINNGGSACIGYQIQFFQGTSWEQLVDSQTQTSFTKTGLITGKFYQFLVYSISNNGIGRSGTVGIYITNKTVPDPPINLMGLSKSSSQLNLSWKPPSSNGGSAITGYEIWWDQGNETWLQLVAFQQDQSFTQTGLTAQKPYSFKVAAINKIGASVFSLNGTFITISNCKIIYDQQFVQEPINYTIGSTAAPFKIPTYSLYACTQEKYLQYWYCECLEISSNIYKAIGFISPSGGSIEETDNSKKGRYTCRVGVWTQNWIDFDGSFTFQLEMSLVTAPDPPTNLMISSQTSTSVNFSWTVPSNNGGSDVTGYEIWFATENEDWQFYTQTKETSISATGLDAGITYSCKIAAINSYGTGVFSQIYTYKYQENAQNSQSPVYEPINGKITEDMSPEQKQKFLDKILLDWQKANAKLNVTANAVSVPPNPLIKEANQQGKILILFSSDINIVPDLQLLNNGTIYLDQFTLRRDLDRRINPRYLEKERIPVLSVKIIPGLESNASDLQFSWNVTNQNTKSMEVQLYFYTPLKVSANSEPDQLEIQFNDPSLFTSTNGLKMAQNAQILRTKLPTQMPLDKYSPQLAQTIGNAKNAAKGVVIGNFILNFIMSSSLNMLWSMINTQQLIVLMPCFDLQMPANAQNFFKQINKIASFNIIDIQPLINKALHLNETEPFSQNFEAIGFESIYFMNNMGSLLIGFLIYFFGLFATLILSPFLNKRPWIDMLFMQLKNIFLYNQFITMMMESYSSICVCCMIACYNLSFKSYGQIVQSVVNFIFIFLGFAFPLVVVCAVSRDWDPINKEWKTGNMIRRRYGAIFEELIFDNGPQLLTWPCYFLLRRLLMALIVVVFKKFFWMQIFLCSMTILTSIIIIGESNFFETDFKKSMEFANECLIMLMLYNMIIFSPFVPDVESRFQVGYFCCIVEAAALAANICFIMLSNLQRIIFVAKLEYAKKNLSSWRSRLLRSREIGMLLRKRRAKERENLEWDYGYEEDRQFENNEQSDDEEIESPKQIKPKLKRKKMTEKYNSNQILSKLDEIVEESNESESENQSSSESEIQSDLEYPSVLLKEKEYGPHLLKKADNNRLNAIVDNPLDISDEDDSSVGSIISRENSNQIRLGIPTKQKDKSEKMENQKVQTEVTLDLDKVDQLPIQQLAQSNSQNQRDFQSSNQIDEALLHEQMDHSPKDHEEKKVQLKNKGDCVIHQKERPEFEEIKKIQYAELKEQMFVFQTKRQKICQINLQREIKDKLKLAQEKNYAQKIKDILKNPAKHNQVQPFPLINDYFEDFVKQENIKNSQRYSQRESNHISAKREIEERVKQATHKDQQPDELLKILDKLEGEINKDEEFDELDMLPQNCKGYASEIEVNKFLGLSEKSSRKEY